MPNAVGQRRNALPQQLSDRIRFRTILREQAVHQDDLAVICLTWLVFWSNVPLADAINRPNTRAANVPISPAVNFTTSFESGSDGLPTTEAGRRTEQGAAEYHRENNNEINRSFMIRSRRHGR